MLDEIAEPKFGDDALARYVAKLESRRLLNDADRRALLALPGAYRDHGANQTILAEGARATHCIILQHGFVSRAKSLRSGGRQILAFHLPGDAVDLQCVLFDRTDHGIHTHTATRTFWVAHADILALTDARPDLARMLWLDTLVDGAIFREWTLNVGQRSARERIAHLFLELYARFEAIGMAPVHGITLPITQTAMAEALGLSLVHLNKSLKVMRDSGLLSNTGRITPEDRARLTRFIGFDAGYLHLRGEALRHASPDLADLAAAQPQP